MSRQPGSWLTKGYRSLVRPGLFGAYSGDPERIHEAMIKALGSGGTAPARALARFVITRPKDPVEIAGVKFPGRAGLAAGLDKDGIAARAWAGLGFAFAELGTVTAQAQPGNPKPRMFRLPRSGGIINRMGFNNAGASALAHRLAAWGVVRGENTLGIPLGISIGKTKLVTDDETIDDYKQSLVAVHNYADYVAVNISSPNTPGLRDWQASGSAYDLVKALVDLAGELDDNPQPIFVKVSPDLHAGELDSLLEAVVRAGAFGLIATNTTLSRDGIRPKDLKSARQDGGLSGAPLAPRARAVVARCVRSGLPVIASGGIMTAADAQAMLDLGAQAVQLYTGFIYAGPGLVSEINGQVR